MPLLVNIAKQQTVELTDQPIVIGRDTTCNLCISDALLSRSHAKISRMSNGRYKIADLSSTHGTYIAGERISERVLVSGDEIVLGATRLRFYEDSSEYTAGESLDREVQTPVIDPLESYPNLESIWQTGADFLNNYKQDCEPGRLFHPAARAEDIIPEATPGALLSLNIRFLDRDANFHVHARVLDRQTGGDKPGLLLEFVKEEKDRQELVLACAKGESIPYFRRRHERVPCRLAAMVETEDGRKLSSTAIDISEGGARLAFTDRLEPGARITLSLSCSENKPFIFFPKPRLILYARVVSVLTRGLQKSAGVEFLFESPKQRDKLGKEVNRLRTKRSK